MKPHMIQYGIQTIPPPKVRNRGCINGGVTVRICGGQARPKATWTHCTDLIRWGGGRRTIAEAFPIPRLHHPAETDIEVFYGPSFAIKVPGERQTGQNENGVHAGIPHARLQPIRSEVLSLLRLAARGRRLGQLRHRRQWPSLLLGLERGRRSGREGVGAFMFV